MASPPTTVNLRLPSKYASSCSSSSSSSPPPSSSPAPPLEWLIRTWCVTHSTLSMWRDARNVRITYAPLPAKPDGIARVDDLVEYEPNKTTPSAALKSVKGVDTASKPGAAETWSWDWRGKGWLFFVGSHWEVLGWGERPHPESGETERWAVTWFAPTVFTKEGVDVYCDRREGLSAPAYADVLAALRALEAEELVAMVERDMRPVEISLPWKER